ncbi:hypothetical protein BU26DRAFT_595474 [Trematosphaeria pertusa]|uniref:Uncharacterized protein n=1 Tax=Trematosphaeria pertusa TaxID=390896 RepID=A0A6A6ID30_9PLEO|nr:uncharacterized protein BU26DRAFT_595474 [Trematosphaeria pertusa]KAF2247802.1 hypothetical protein BU26DRAFT_595474 [Trematosphaeria pertusa]
MNKSERGGVGRGGSEGRYDREWGGGCSESKRSRLLDCSRSEGVLKERGCRRGRGWRGDVGGGEEKEEGRRTLGGGVLIEGPGGACGGGQPGSRLAGGGRGEFVVGDDRRSQGGRHYGFRNYCRPRAVLAKAHRKDRIGMKEAAPQDIRIVCSRFDQREAPNNRRQLAAVQIIRVLAVPQEGRPALSHTDAPSPTPQTAAHSRAGRQASGRQRKQNEKETNAMRAANIVTAEPFYRVASNETYPISSAPVLYNVQRLPQARGVKGRFVETAPTKAPGATRSRTLTYQASLSSRELRARRAELDRTASATSIPKRKPESAKLFIQSIPSLSNCAESWRKQTVYTRASVVAWDHTGQRSAKEAPDKKECGETPQIPAEGCLGDRKPVVGLENARLLKRAHRRSAPRATEGYSMGGESRGPQETGWGQLALILGGGSTLFKRAENTSGRRRHTSAPDVSKEDRRRRQQRSGRLWDDDEAGGGLPAAQDDDLEAGQSSQRLPAGSHGQAKDQGLWVADAQNAETARPTQASPAQFRDELLQIVCCRSGVARPRSTAAVSKSSSPIMRIATSFDLVALSTSSKIRRGTLSSGGSWDAVCSNSFEFFRRPLIFPSGLG